MKLSDRRSFNVLPLIAFAAVLLPLSSVATAAEPKRLSQPVPETLSATVPETVVATTRTDGGNGRPIQISISSADDYRTVRRLVAAPVARPTGSR